MSSINHFIQNRPVHLARRDAYYQEAVSVLKNKQNQTTAMLSVSFYDEILFLLKVARLHSRFCIRTLGENENDEQFANFVDLLAGNTKAVLSMLQLRDLVARNSSFDFLGTNKATVGLHAEEYQRRANDTITALMATLNLAERTFINLKEKNADSLDKEEKSRYNKAYDHVKILIKKRQHYYTIAPSLGKLTEQ
ncbi:MAG: hypothetical protein ACJ0BW_03550 [Pontiellaceae bacterium]